MLQTFGPSEALRALRARLGHPIIDGDGHQLEFMPAVYDIVAEQSGPDVAAALRAYRESGAATTGGFDPVRVFWGVPAENTLDRMTMTLPKLLYERLDEFGIDFALLYPSAGLLTLKNPHTELRQAEARALNTYSAESFAEYRDRLEPVAVIPSFTPDEAVAELEHAVGVLGLKTVVMSGSIPRREADGGHMWVDTLGHGSRYDYDPVWACCARLGVVPAFHGNGYGWGTRASATNYVFNHLGSFAAAQEGVCRSIVMGGVARRFPRLRFAFLEGGVSWSAQLFADLVGHFGKRNREAVMAYDPKRIDRALHDELFDRYATGRIARLRAGEVSGGVGAISRWSADEQDVDDFARSGITSVEDIVEIFTRQLYFGCEADDPLNALAFALGLPHDVRLNALFASDIGHWDVADARDVVHEAYELVEHGQIGVADFRAFTCDNVGRMLTDLNPSFFDATALAGVEFSAR